MKNKYLIVVLFLIYSFSVDAQWTGSHIGTRSNVVGNFEIVGDQIEINSSGADIWNMQDDFYFVHQAVCGDFSIVTRLDALQNTGTWVKSGLMIRENLTDTSPYAFISTYQPDNTTGTCMQLRLTDGGTSQNSNCNANININTWYKLAREGKTVTSYSSTDGNNWEVLDSRELEFSNLVYIGIASTSFDADQLGRAVYSQTSLEESSAATSILMEAEDVNFGSAYELNENDYFASGTQYLKVKEGFANQNQPVDGLLEYPFNACNAADYNLWVRVKAENSNLNKLWFKVNEQAWQQSQAFDYSQNWQWQRLQANSVELASGTNKVTLSYYSDNLSIDRIMITDSLEFIPEGFDDGQIYGPSIYLSADGNDNNSGATVDKPWKSIDKLNTALNGVLPGTVIYFRKGDVFRGEIALKNSGANNAPVKFTSYGTGDQPIISGAVTIDGWQHQSGNIYSAHWTGPAPAQLFIDDQLVLHARYPNMEDGFLFNTEAIGVDGFVAGSLAFPKEVIEGSVVRVRSNAWTWENKIVSSYEGGNILYDNKAQYEFKPNFGFYFDGKPEFIDTPNEWALDKQKDSIYLYFPQGKNPQSSVVSGSIFQNGITLPGGEKHVTIEDLHFSKLAQHAIDVSTSASNQVKILNNTFTGINKTAVNLRGKDIDVVSNHFQDIINNAIYGFNVTGVNILENEMKRVGVNFGYGQTGQHNTCGIYILNSNNTLISENKLDSIGYGGILAYCTNSIIEKNIISYVGLTLNDVGALYCWGPSSNNSIWRNNIALYTYGNRYGTVGINENQPSSLGFGVYFDNGTFDLVAENNTIAYNSSGMLSNSGSHENSFIGNISYKNNSYQLAYTNDIAAGSKYGGDGVMYGMKAERNILFAVNRFNRPFTIKGTDILELGTVKANYYMNPWDKEGLMTANIPWHEWVEEMNDTLSHKSFYYIEGEEEDPSELFINNSSEEKTIELSGDYVDLNNNSISQLVLPPYSSKVVIKDVDLNIITGIEDKLSSLITVYPNPAAESIIIDGLDHSFQVQLVNMNGRVVQSQESVEAGTKLSIKNLTPGLYIIKITGHQGVGFSKIIKQ